MLVGTVLQTLDFDWLWFSVTVSVSKKTFLIEAWEWHLSVGIRINIYNVLRDYISLVKGGCRLRGFGQLPLLFKVGRTEMKIQGTQGSQTVECDYYERAQFYYYGSFGNRITSLQFSKDAFSIVQNIQAYMKHSNVICIQKSIWGMRTSFTPTILQRLRKALGIPEFLSHIFGIPNHFLRNINIRFSHAHITYSLFTHIMVI